MPGPTPKEPALRQRRNKSTTRAKLSAELEPRKRAPSLPRRIGEDWHPMTKRWWKDIWHSPMASEYLKADEHALYRLAALVDKFWNNPNKELAAEIRLEQQAFGLTPLDRRRLEWSIEQAETAKSRSRAKPTKRKKDQTDPRDVLSKDVVILPERPRKQGEASLPN